MDRKIFCIGLNKTGTSSLHAAFKILAIKSVHFKDDSGNNIKDIILNNYLSKDNILQGLEHYDAFSDWNKGNHSLDIFKEFDKQYPNSKFILNIREVSAWLDSREKHVKRNQERKKKYPNEDITWLKIDRASWETYYHNHYNEVFDYFKNRKDDLLIFDVSKGDGWEKLCPFLDVPIPNVPFPRKNTAPENKSLLYRVYFKIRQRFFDY